MVHMTAGTNRVTFLVGAGLAHPPLPMSVELVSKVKQSLVEIAAPPASSGDSTALADLQLAALRFLIGGIRFQEGVLNRDPDAPVNIEQIAVAALELEARHTNPLAPYTSGWHQRVFDLEERCPGLLKKFVDFIYSQLTAWLTFENLTDIAHLAGLGEFCADGNGLDIFWRPAPSAEPACRTDVCGGQGGPKRPDPAQAGARFGGGIKDRRSVQVGVTSSRAAHQHFDAYPGGPGQSRHTSTTGRVIRASMRDLEAGWSPGHAAQDGDSFMANDIVPVQQDALLPAMLPRLLDRIRPAWQSKGLIRRVRLLLPVDPSSACQKMFNAAIRDLRDKIVVAGLDIAREAARQHKLPPLENRAALPRSGSARASLREGRRCRYHSAAQAPAHRTPGGL